MKKPWTERVGDFVAGKGFYIVLFLCVAAIGISGYYLYSTFGSSKEDTAVDGPARVVVTPTPPVSPPAATPAPTPAPTPTPTPAPTPTPTPEPTSSPEASPSSEPTLATPVYTWPVKGEVLNDFSLEVLAYDETMGDWRTHCGIDIAAVMGTEVLAISSGTVEQVYQDDLMGTTVIINHGDELRSIYSNLAGTPTVVEGDTVSTGSVIGSVGSTALAESGSPSHLHLEIAKDGLVVDPTLYLPG